MKGLTVVVALAAACLVVAGCQAHTEPVTIHVSDVAGDPDVLDTTDAGPTDEMIEDRPDVEEFEVEAPAVETYTMKAGDTLYSLARRFYGDGKKWTVIFEANKDKIRDVTEIPIGTVLVIPAD